MKIVAIDLGKSKSTVCVFESTAGKHRFTRINTRPGEVHGVLAAESPGRVVIEVGSQAGWVRDLCRGMDLEIQVANPNHEAWRWKNVKRKTDRDDALRLARLSAMDQLPTVHVPEKGVRQWRSLIEYRTGVMRRLCKVKSSIRSILTREAIDWPKGDAGFSVRALKELQAMADDPAAQREGDHGLWRLMLREELVVFAAISASLKRLDKRLDALGKASKNVRLLRTIPGVGPRLSEVVAAVIDDPRRFKSGKQVACYAGLTPRQYQSGSMDRKGKISKQGNRLLRSLLVEVGWIGQRYNPWMKEVYERARRGSKSRKKIAVVALARRLVVVCWAMLRDQTEWRDPTPAPTPIAPGAIEPAAAAGAGRAPSKGRRRKAA